MIDVIFPRKYRYLPILKVNDQRTFFSTKRVGSLSLHDYDVMFLRNQATFGNGRLNLAGLIRSKLWCCKSGCRKGVADSSRNADRGKKRSEAGADRATRQLKQMNDL